MSAPVTSEHKLSTLLGEKASMLATGILTAARGKMKRLFCIEKGLVVFATSNIIEEQFIEYIVQEALLSPADRAAATQAAAEEKRKPLEVVLERGFVDGETLRRAMESQIEALLRSCLSWPDGDYSFDSGMPNLDGQVKGRVSLVPVILQHVQRYPGAIDQVMTRIGPPDSKLAATKRVKLVFSEIEPDDTTRVLIERADGSKGAGEMAKEVPGDTDAALRIIYGLRLLGVMDAKQEEIIKEAASEPALTRDEVLGRLARAMGGDHYTVLGLERKASRERIRDAYYSLARRMHPDRFRTGDLQDLLARIEKFFKRVTEAYNTLYDPDLRREYNEMLESTFKKTEDTEKTDTRYLAKQNYLRGKELIEKRRFVDAVSFLENAVRMDDSQADYHYELGTLLVRNPRRKQDAEHHLFRTSQIDPSRWGVYLALGHLYRRAEKVHEAARMFREVLKWEKEQPDAIRELKEMGLPVKARGEEDAGFNPLFGS